MNGITKLQSKESSRKGRSRGKDKFRRRITDIPTPTSEEELEEHKSASSKRRRITFPGRAKQTGKTLPHKSKGPLRKAAESYKEKLAAEENSEINRSKDANHTVENSKSVISEVQEGVNTRLINELEHYRRNPKLSIRIANMTIKMNKVIINYVPKHGVKGGGSLTDSQQNPSEDATSASKSDDEKEELEKAITGAHVLQTTYSSPTYDNVQKDLIMLEKVIRAILPETTSLKINKIDKIPQFVPTAGLSSRLELESTLNILNRDRLVTALLTGRQPGRDYILTVGHFAKKGVANIIEDNGDAFTHIPVGRVTHTITNNGEEQAYVDAAIIQLNEGVLDTLRQSFTIDGVPRRLKTQPDWTEEGRVILRALNQQLNDSKGYVVTNALNILDGGNIFEECCTALQNFDPMYRLVQIVRYSDDGNHRNAIHSQGESGLLCTYEPSPPQADFVTPVAMIIGSYEYSDDDGHFISDCSVAIDLRRVLNRMSTEIDDNLQIYPVNT